MVGDERGEMSGCSEGGVDLLRVAGTAVVDPAEVQFEAVASAATLQCQIGQVVDIGRRLRRVEEVAGWEGVAGVELAHVCSE